MLRESQLSTRNMVNGVTEEFWKMVRDSINEQALNFKSNIYNAVYMYIQLSPSQFYRGYMYLLLMLMLTFEFLSQL